MAIFNIVAAGLMLGLPYLLTGKLGLSIGLHIGWNLFQGNVFGFPVSGFEPSGATVFAIEQAGPPILTGGAFGPEGGLLGLLVIGAICGIILLRVRLLDRAAISSKVSRPPTNELSDQAR